PLGPGTDLPLGPGTDRPLGPGTDRPLVPGTDLPLGPGTDRPLGPGTDRPLGPGTDRPLGPGTDRPIPVDTSTGRPLGHDVSATSVSPEEVSSLVAVETTILSSSESVPGVSYPITTPSAASATSPSVSPVTQEDVTTPSPVSPYTEVVYVDITTLTVPDTSSVSATTEEYGIIPTTVSGDISHEVKIPSEGELTSPPPPGFTEDVEAATRSTVDEGESETYPTTTESAQVTVSAFPILNPDLLPSTQSPTDVPSRPCGENSDCWGDEVCWDGECVDGCALVRCGYKAQCATVRHRPVCTCLSGHRGNPLVECLPQLGVLTPRPPTSSSECRTNRQCGEMELCHSGSCVDPCVVGSPCGLNAECTVRRHRPRCWCPQGYQGDPHLLCRPAPPTPSPGCSSDLACPDDKVCYNRECRNPCDLANPCAAKAKCRTLAHRPLCTCDPGYSGDPYTFCSLDNVIITGCRGDADCPSTQACINNECRYPCEDDPCGTNAECINSDHSAQCRCRNGFQGDPFKGCSPVGCFTPDDCAVTEECYSGQCVSPCRPGNNPCPPTAVCRTLAHAATCMCPPGHTGLPLQGCSPLPTCGYNSDCPADKACIERVCGDPCGAAPCPQGSLCRVEDHRPICLCPPGYTGNPEVGCVRSGCESDSECPRNRVCRKGTCVDPCQDCGQGALCQALAGTVICLCPVGFTGNPRFSCDSIPGFCSSDIECQLREACLDGECRDPCTTVPPPCGVGARCRVINHRTICQCPDGYEGDPRDLCTPVSTPTPGCQYNQDCPSNKACDRLSRNCIDPCEDACAPTAICQAIDHRPYCQCPPGYSGNANIECAIPVGCRDDSKCPSTQACINNKCQDPCVCGSNAVCEVVSHRAICRCPPGYIGDPFRGCQVPTNPCDTDPCGDGALCELDNGNPICVCPRGTTGNPFEKCIPEGEDCEPNSCGPNSGCRMVGGVPMCFCLPEFVGNPPSVPCSPPANPCEPSPCGPNTACNVVNGFHRCTCLPGFVGKPNTIRGCEEPANPCVPSPCGSGAICDADRSPFCFCRPGLVGDPYTGCREPPPTCTSGVCGQNAECYVRSNSLQCRCLDGYDGDPRAQCLPRPGNPCEPNPCGANTQCRVGNNNRPVCTCSPSFFGEPGSEKGCRPECAVDDDCSLDLACVNTRCIDPCPSACGINSLCEVNTHRPVCYCPAGFKGNPYTRCEVVSEPIPPKEGVTSRPPHPCVPSPCGLNTNCHVEDSQAVCSCVDGYIGDPKDRCRPECVSNADCDDDEACIDQKCGDPCPGLCGTNALCDVVHHNPICYCPSNLAGDPFRFCVTRPPTPEAPPCEPNPCGPNSECRPTAHNKDHVCSCLPGFFGSPCRRLQCTINSDCPPSKACVNFMCVNPCPGSCGLEALCSVVAHNPICRCPDGLTGDPFNRCYQKEVPQEPTDPQPPAPPSPLCSPSCGDNAECQIVDGVGSCVCLSGYYGRPELGCTPECIINSDCVNTRACINQRCIDPCLGACGVEAFCNVVNHKPICACRKGYVGDPFRLCRPAPHPPVTPVPCQRSPCGENARCTNRGTEGVCTCLPGFLGNPYAQCNPECVVSSDCAMTQACISQKCRDPCPGTCANNARCSVISHNPVCVCPSGYKGDPFTACTPILPIPTIPQDKINPCVPDPCGPNAVCRVGGDVAVCECRPGTFGNPNVPTGCRYECLTNTECPMTQACINRRCMDPCVGTCGLQALCQVIAHNPRCRCPDGFQGDPYYSCTYTPIFVSPESELPTEIPVEDKDPCLSSPCGPYAKCSSRDHVYTCTCEPGYFGNPYTGCVPECIVNSGCPAIKACINQHCVDPCPGSCGLNSECHVLRHQPNCYCPAGYTGDPYSRCFVDTPVVTPKPPVHHPCAGDPCGPNAICREVNRQRQCFCQPGYVGRPPTCRPECLVHAECLATQACINNRCVDPCKGTCGVHTECRVINHDPICSCLPGYTGDSFTRCTIAPTPPPRPVITPTPRPLPPIAGTQPPGSEPVIVAIPGDPTITQQPLVIIPQPPAPPPTIPCLPDPCGANTICREHVDTYLCECRPGYYGNPDVGCRPECVLSTDCDSGYSCIRHKCMNPCPAACASTAVCTVVNHGATCSCPPHLQGDPYIHCAPLPIIGSTPFPPPVTPVVKEPCAPNPCGQNAECLPNSGECRCLPGYFGNPYFKCEPECTTDPQCPFHLACVNQKCIDPCPGTCGRNAECQVVNHDPVCYCRPGYSGDPYEACRVEITTPTRPEDPCTPSPCGPNSRCHMVHSRPVCECLPGYYNSPPNCRPECIVNADCVTVKACVNQKCRDPCVGTCGTDAQCEVTNHNPICFCPSHLTGDPFVRCYEHPVSPSQEDPCVPDPCGRGADCTEKAGVAVCTCKPGLTGNPYDICRHDCVVNSDCARDKACSRNKCVDPCPGACGVNAECRVSHHSPSCTCPPHLTGDPFSRCVLATTTPETPDDPCSPPPCGLNARCERDGSSSYRCECVRDYFGDPYTECRPECVVNTDCASDQACRNLKCIDPCPGTCGTNAECDTINHSPICTCLSGYQGNPYVTCRVPDKEKRPNPCLPNPCGPFSTCRVVRQRPVCECVAGYYGAPPQCHPECVTNSDCPKYLACVKEKCVDPCVGTCGRQAQCQVVNHNPLCSCPAGYSGDPYIQCALLTTTTRPVIVITPLPTSPPRPEVTTPPRPCAPNPCGQNAQCSPQGQYFECSCPPPMFGNPYVECRLECVVDSDCGRNKACERNECVDPCTGLCGVRAECHVIMHKPVCMCPLEYTGDAYTACSPSPTISVSTVVPPKEFVDPCREGICGPNADCRVQGTRGVCTCKPGYFGNPYNNCRPECVINSQCPKYLACVNQRCEDPCPGTCGIDAICDIVNHNPVCSCQRTMTGDPFVRCEPIRTPLDPCNPTPCGSYTNCRVMVDRAVCSCVPGYVGNPDVGCKPECTINSDCLVSQACVNQKCVDPCVGVCGSGADCNVFGHNPLCTCAEGLTGDPLVACEIKKESPVDPCNPSPCGSNTNCAVKENGQAVCTCFPNYFGNPYLECRVECTINSDCPKYLACVNQKCRDPCQPGTCGLNAVCDAVNHQAICTCPRRYDGNPKVECVRGKYPP
ncbi:Neurogenic locus Notch protein-like 4, partial [Homarus americanus]